MIILAYILSGLSLLLSALFVIRLKFPSGFYVVPFKLIAGTFSPYWAILGALGAGIGWMYQAWCWYDDNLCLHMHPRSQGF